MKMFSGKRSFKFFMYLLIISAVWFGARLLTDIFLNAARISATGTIYDIIFIFSLATVIILFLSLKNFFVLYKDKRGRIPGSRIRSRLTYSFLLVTFIPVLILGGVIAFIVSTGLKAVYRPEVEAVLNKTVVMLRKQRRGSRTRLLKNVQIHFRKNRTHFIASNHSIGRGILLLGRVGKDLNGIQGIQEGIRSRLEEPIQTASLVPLHHNERIAYLYRNPMKFGLEFALIDPQGKDGATAGLVAASLGNYRQLRVLRDPLAAAFVYLTVFAFILSTLFVFLVSLRISRSLTKPLKDLGEATKRVALGDLEYRVAYPRHDAIGFLVDNFNQMTDELSRSRLKLYNVEKVAAWQEVARRLAHEIKNPLTPIRLAAERVMRHSEKEGVDLRPVVSKTLPTILSEVQVIQELVDEFSAFARMPTIHLKPMEANVLFAEFVSSYNEVGGDSRIIYTPAINSLPIFVDPTQMRRAVFNIFQNAIRAIENLEEGVVRVKLKENGKHVQVSIMDNGLGISEEIRENIFQPYFTASPGGTGLGLAIVQKIVLEHGGNIWFQSVVNEGTTFYIELPLRSDK